MDLAPQVGVKLASLVAVNLASMVWGGNWLCRVQAGNGGLGFAGCGKTGFAGSKLVAVNCASLVGGYYIQSVAE